MNIESFKAVAQDALAGATKYINTHHVGQLFCAAQAVIGTAMTVSYVVFGKEVKHNGTTTTERNFSQFLGSLIYTGLNAYGAVNPFAGVLVPIMDLGVLTISNSKATKPFLFSALLAAGLSLGVNRDLSGFDFSHIKF